MKILFFDTETTWLPISWASVDSQPKLVQFWWIYWEYKINWLDYNIISEKEIDIIFNPWIDIPKQASDVHWITNEIAKEHWLFSEYASELMKMTIEADIIVCHNVPFDSKLIFWEIERLNKNWEKRKDWEKMFLDKSICTMKIWTNFCKIPGRFWQYKWAKLSELHIKLFWEDFDNAHNAFADIVATRKCFFELYKLWLINLVKKS